LQNINNLLHRHPELQSKYDGPLGQILINLGNITEANPFIDRTLERTKSNSLSFYIDYAKTTQLISEKKYPQALVTANDLKKRLLEDRKLQPQTGKLKNFDDLLFEFNLLRIAVLTGQIGDKADELKAWKEFSTSVMLSASATHKALPALAIMAPFIEGKLTLEDYIRHQENALNSAIN
jgi:hypothetical protein